MKKDAKHGEKMIEIKVRFWTDKLAGEKGKILPKNIWGSGVIRFEGNEPHGIRPIRSKKFNSLLELSAVIERAPIEQGVKVHPSRKMKRYMTT